MEAGEVQREAAECSCCLGTGDVVSSLAGQMPGGQQKGGLLARCPVAAPLLCSPGTVVLPAKGHGSSLPALRVKSCGWPVREKIERLIFSLHLTGGVAMPRCLMSARLGKGIKIYSLG